jgi:hypothetical protein
MDCSLFDLKPLGENQEKQLLISLKLNNQLQTILEDESCNCSFEIEFTSLTDGKIYCGSTVFNLKISESADLVSPNDFYREKVCRG